MYTKNEWDWANRASFLHLYVKKEEVNCQKRKREIKHLKGQKKIKKLSFKLFKHYIIF